MARAPVRHLTFDLRALGPDGSGAKWNWSVYEGRDERFLRDGQVQGGPEKAESAARSAMALMGGVVREAGDD